MSSFSNEVYFTLSSGCPFTPISPFSGAIHHKQHPSQFPPNGKLTAEFPQFPPNLTFSLRIQVVLCCWFSLFVVFFFAFAHKSIGIAFHFILPKPKKERVNRPKPELIAVVSLELRIGAPACVCGSTRQTRVSSHSCRNRSHLEHSIYFYFDQSICQRVCWCRAFPTW